MVKVKICCISSLEEATMAIDAGADALGLVGPMPSGPGVISNEEIAEIVANIPKEKEIKTFLLTSETTAKGIIEHYNRIKSTTIQIVDRIEMDQYPILREALPDVELIQVVHVVDEEALEEAKAVSKWVDVVLLDSGNPNLAVKELGGTGKTHNWTISKAIVDSLDIPVFLAGGLKAENVQEAIHQVQPYGLDLCSGVRKDGDLNAGRLGAFFEAVRTA